MKPEIIIALFICLSCGSKKVQKAQSTEPIKRKTEDVVSSDSLHENDSSREEVFYFSGYEGTMKQTLRIEQLSNDSLKFKLFMESELCDYTQDGIAVLREGHGPEIDNDEEEVGYFVSEFFVVDGGKLWTIRIGTDDRDKARITYIYDDPRDECDPLEDLMRKTTSNNQ